LAFAPDGIEKLWWGGKVRGLRVVLRDARIAAVAKLLKQAWLRKAPKALTAARR
jgi:hypothetical protein